MESHRVNSIISGRSLPLHSVHTKTKGDQLFNKRRPVITNNAFYFSEI